MWSSLYLQDMHGCRRESQNNGCYKSVQPHLEVYICTIKKINDVKSWCWECAIPSSKFFWFASSKHAKHQLEVVAQVIYHMALCSDSKRWFMCQCPPPKCLFSYKLGISYQSIYLPLQACNYCSRDLQVHVRWEETNHVHLKVLSSWVHTVLLLKSCSFTLEHFLNHLHQIIACFLAHKYVNLQWGLRYFLKIRVDLGFSKVTQICKRHDFNPKPFQNFITLATHSCRSSDAGIKSTGSSKQTLLRSKIDNSELVTSYLHLSVEITKVFLFLFLRLQQTVNRNLDSWFESDLVHT